MDAWIKVMVLAVVQGVTEFLPISSSGHLVLGKHLLHLESPSTGLEIALHGGTLISILIYFRSTLLSLCAGFFRAEREAVFYAAHVVVATVPAVLVYMALGTQIEAFFDRPVVALACLGITGCVLLSTRRVCGRDKPVSMVRAGVVGMAQAVAMIPGISRSGMTIAVARHLGVPSRHAAEFSLLMSVPLLIGAPLVSLLGPHSEGMGDVTVPALCAGMIVSAMVGYAAIALLMRVLSRGRFWMFGVYCLAVSVVGLAGAALI